MSSFARLPHDLLRLWERMPRAQKLMLAAVGALALSMFVFFYTSARSAPMATLYSQLEPEDAGAVTSELDTLGIPYELAGGGSAVRVPSNTIDRARIELAQRGLPQGGAVGFEIFDRTNFGVTDFAQRVNFQRGLEGELARTIRQMSLIDGARVHIVMPERRVFSDFQEPATASVVLQMKPGRRLDDSQVRGVAHLVAGSVVGLDRENLTIIDTSGNILFDGADDALSLGSLSGSQLQVQRSFETTLERDVGRMLQQTLGPNMAAVQVHAELNFDRVEVSSETFQPEGAAAGTPRSQSLVEETFQGSSASAAAVPGVAANVPGAAINTTGSGNDQSQYQRTETTTNFELSRTTQRTIQAPGAVENLSVSVLLNDTVPEEQATALTQSIAAAVGLNEARGDRIVVTRIPFDTTAIDEAQAAIAEAGAQDQMLTYLRLALPVLAVLLALFIFWFLRRSLRTAGHGWVYDPSVQVLAPAGLPASLGGGDIGRLPPGAAQLPDLPNAEEVRKREAVGQRVSSLARTQPEAVAEVLQSWLKEE